MTLRIEPLLSVSEMNQQSAKVKRTAWILAGVALAVYLLFVISGVVGRG